jgi:expansin (peptidoglycan-binding protein)
MRRLVGSAWVVVVLSSALACSNDDSSSSLGNGGPDAGSGGAHSSGDGGAGLGGSRAGAGNGGTVAAGGSAGRGGRAGAGGLGAAGRANSGGAIGSGGNANGGTVGSGGAGGAVGAGGAGASTGYGQIYSGGQFHLGPVDYDETQWHNACAPTTKYAPSVRQAEGNLLAGLWNGISNVASYCDACISVTTDKGKSAVLRVVTYGDTTTNSIDVSPEAYAILNSGEYPRSMKWQFTECPDTGKIMYEFQTGSNQWWTSFWVRNARVPITAVEVQSANHSSFVAVQRGSDGTLTDGGGFGQGPFTIRLTGVDGQQVTDSFDWPAAGIAGAMLTGQGNFQ